MPPRRRSLAILPLLLLSTAFGQQLQAIRYNPGFFATPVSRGDDATSEPIPLGFNVNFYGRIHNVAYVNTNGNLTFSRPLESFLPVPLSQLKSDIIAAFYADVDTRAPNSRTVSFGYDLADGRFAFAANWLDVGYFSQKQDKRNGFQIVLIDRTDTGAGNFDIELNYGYIQWESGDLSGGVNGIGGIGARAGFSSGTFTYELPGSGSPAGFLDSSVTALNRRRLNNDVPGRMYFQCRNGIILQSLLTSQPVLSFSLPPRIVASRPLSFSATGNPIAANIASNAPWLRVSRTEITTPTAVDVLVDSANAAPGLNQALLTITPANPQIAPVRVPVTLSVGQPAPTCSYTLNAGSLSVSSAAGRYGTDVKAPAGCSWRATSNVDWIRIATGLDGAGDGSVTFDVSPNPTSGTRAGTIVVAGRTFTVLQSGAFSQASVADSRVCRIETLAGNGDAAYYGDEVIGANAVAFNNPLGVFATQSNAIFIADTANKRVRRFTTGFVRNIQALRFDPSAIGYGPQGDIYLTDAKNHQVYRITYDGRFEHFAGAGDPGFGEPGYSGDFGLAIAAKLNSPRGIAVGSNGTVYIADTGNHVIRAVDRITGVITTFAGRGRPGFGGDGDYASNALLTNPEGLSFDNKGNLYVADTGNHRIRRISPEALLTTIAGFIGAGFTNDGQQALLSRFNSPSGVAADSLGYVYVADRGNHRIRMIRPDGIVATIAGNGRPGFNGDGIGNLSLLSSPNAVSVDGEDRIVLADTGNHRLRRISCAAGLLPSQTQPVISDAIGTATSLPRITQYSYLTLRGTNLALTTAFWDNYFPDARTLPTEVAGVRVKVNGKFAYPYFVSPTAVTIITPGEAAAGTIPIELSNENGIAFTTAEIATFAPGFYLNDFQGRKYVAATLPNEVEFIGPDRPAKPGDRVTLIATGLGPVFPQVPEGLPLAAPAFVPATSNLKLFLNGRQVPVESAAMTSLGLFQVVFNVPDGLEGDVTVELQVGGESTQPAALLAVAAP
jgi:uncharacterized protein (TIGR03437 family)